MTVPTHGTTGSTEAHPADVAQQETSRVTGEAARQARDLAGEFRSQIATQAGTQKSRAAEQLRSLSDGLEEMAQNGAPGPAQGFITEIASRTRGFADYVENREPDELLDEVRNVARRRPVVFLAGAAVTGAVLGRLSRGVVSAATGGGTPSRPVSTPQPAYGTTITGGYAVTDTAPVDVAPATVSPHGTSTSSTAGISGATLGSAAGSVGTDGGDSGVPPRASGTEGSFHG
jgi:hypothetical protein